ncbi:MAG: sulfite exporter TauE/SafE family protein [Nitrososphaerales archaeon]
MIEAVLAGFILGVSNSVRCTSICLPILSVQLITGKKTVGNSLFIVTLFSLGRLMSYLAISTIFYLAAAQINVFETPLVKGLTSLSLGFVMIYHCYKSLVKSEQASCKTFSQGRIPFLLGYLTSFSACLPLLSVLSMYSASNLSFAYAAVGMFWIGSSVLPLAATLPFFGLFRLKDTSAIQRITSIGALAGGILGLTFIVNSAQILIG